MTRVRQPSDNDLPLVDRRARSGTVLRILLLALVLVAAAAAFVYFKDSLENEIVLGILGVLAMMGIFFLVSSIIGFIEVMPQSRSDGLARRFLSAHPDGTLITDAKGRMVYANATYCRMTGTTKASDIQSLETLLSRSRESTEALYRLINLLREGRDGYEEFRLLKPLSENATNGGPHWYRLKGRVLKDVGDEDLHVFQIADITPEREDQERFFRELQNAIERAVILCESPDISADLLGIDVELSDLDDDDFVESAAQGSSNSHEPTEDLSLEDYFQHFVLEHQDHMTETELARKLGISRKCLWERRQRLGIPRRKSATADVSEIR